MFEWGSSIYPLYHKAGGSTGALGE